jgi:hypothetical protein
MSVCFDCSAKAQEISEFSFDLRCGMEAFPDKERPSPRLVGRKTGSQLLSGFRDELAPAGRGQAVLSDGSVKWRLGCRPAVGTAGSLLLRSQKLVHFLRNGVRIVGLFNEERAHRKVVASHFSIARGHYDFYGGPSPPNVVGKR